MNNISITLNKDEIKELTNKYEFKTSTKNQNVAYFLELDNNKITIFKTNVLLIQGKSVELTYHKLFNKKYQSIDPISNKFIDEDGFLNANMELEQYYTNSIGSDEVGNGDFFLGVCVCATYIMPRQIKWLKSLGIKDSKKMSDESILEIGAKLIKRLNFISINLNATEYNDLYSKFNNLNALKAYLHNKCFSELIKNVNKPYFIVIDQFVNQPKYYEYLNTHNIKAIKVDCFSTKAENKYFAVACGAIIARYFHLMIKQEMEHKYNVTIPLGSSNEIIKTFSLDFIKNFGLNEFNNLSKFNFKTYNEIVELANKG